MGLTWAAVPPRLRRFEEARARLGTESYLNLPFLLTLAASRAAAAGVPCDGGAAAARVQEVGVSCNGVLLGQSEAS